MAPPPRPPTPRPRPRPGNRHQVRLAGGVVAGAEDAGVPDRLAVCAAAGLDEWVAAYATPAPPSSAVTATPANRAGLRKLMASACVHNLRPTWGIPLGFLKFVHS